MYRDTKRPAATPRQPFGTLTERQRRVYAYMKARGQRNPYQINWCIDLTDLFEGTTDAEATMEAMIDAGWLRMVGPRDGDVEWTYDIPERDREGYVRPFVRAGEANVDVVPESEWRKPFPRAPPDRDA